MYCCKFCLLSTKLCITACLIPDSGLEVLTGGRPKLVMVKIKCMGVICDGADWLTTCRGKLYIAAIETAEEFTQLFSQSVVVVGAGAGADVAYGSNGQSAFNKALG